MPRTLQVVAGVFDQVGKREDVAEAGLLRDQIDHGGDLRHRPIASNSPADTPHPGELTPRGRPGRSTRRKHGAVFDRTLIPPGGHPPVTRSTRKYFLGGNPWAVITHRVVRRPRIRSWGTSWA